MRYSFTDREIDADSNITAASLIFREFFQDSTITSLAGLSFRADTRNDRVLPTAATSTASTLDGAGLGGFSKFARFEARGAWYHGIPKWLPLPLRDRSSVVRVGARRLRAAVQRHRRLRRRRRSRSGCLNDETCTLDNIDEDFTLPLTERYFLGGLGSYQLRGFKARTVGPRRSILYDTTFQFADRAGRYTPVGRANNPRRPSSAPTAVLRRRHAGVRTRRATTTASATDLNDRDIDDFEDLDETDVVGGNQFISLSGEYRFPISESLGLVGILFFDTGNAFDEDDFLFDVAEWRFGTGVGRALVLAVRTARGLRRLPARQALGRGQRRLRVLGRRLRSLDRQIHCARGRRLRAGGNDARIEASSLCCSLRGSSPSPATAAAQEAVKIARRRSRPGHQRDRPGQEGPRGAAGQAEAGRGAS